MKRTFRWGGAAILAPALLLAACGGGNGDSDAADRTYDEGSVRMEIETLDTGLLKGHSYVEAAEGWVVKDVQVEAVTPNGQEWVVLEIPEETTPEKATVFFEVTIGELPRGQQVTITTKANFASGSGEEKERTASDIWPP